MRVFIDFETRSSVDLRKAGVHKYCESPDFKILMVAWGIDDGPVVLDESLANVDKYLKDPHVTLVAHNASFEAACLNAYGYNIPPERWVCTAQIARSLAYPPSLSKLATFLNVAPKDEAGYDLINLFCKPGKNGLFTEGDEEPLKWEAFKQYCLQDTETLREVYNKLAPSQVNVPASEISMRHLDSKINDHGVPIDLPAAAKAKNMAAVFTDEMSEEFTLLTGLKYTQRDKVFSWLSERGIDIPDMAIRSIKSIEVEKLTPEVKKVVIILRQIKKTSLKKLDTMLTAACNDGTVKGTLLYHGPTTGRWSGRLIQTQNFPKPIVKDVDKAIGFIQNEDYVGIKSMGNPLDVLASCLRGMIKAPKGKEFHVVDFASIEARVLVWLVGQEEELEAYRRGEDLYVQMAAYIFGVKPSEVTKDQRTLGKITILACGFGMGAEKFMLTCDQWGFPVTGVLAKKSVDTFRTKYDRVEKMWRKVQSCVIQVIKTRGRIELKLKYTSIRFTIEGDNLRVTLPSGRKLNYPQASVKDKKTPWGSIQPSPHFYGQVVGRVDWKIQSTYGGSIVQSVVQGIAADALRVSLLKLDEEGYNIAFHVHDEVVCVEDRGSDHSLERMENIMTINPAWATGLPLAVEGYTSERYKK